MSVFVGNVTSSTIEFRNSSVGFVTTDKVGIANVSPENTLDVGSNLSVQDLGTNVMTVLGNVVADYYYGDGRYMTNVVMTANLQEVSNLGSSTNISLQFLNTAYSFTTIQGAKAGISNLNPIHTLDIGSNVYIDDTAEDVLFVNGNITSTGNLMVGGNVTAVYFKGDGTLVQNITSTTTFAEATARSNITSNTIQFLNTTRSFVCAGNVGISNTDPVHTLDVGSKFYVDEHSPNVLVVDGIIVARGFIGDGNGVQNTVSYTDLEVAVNFGNVTSNTVQFNNPQTSFVTFSNVGIANSDPRHNLDIGANVSIQDDAGFDSILTVTGNVQAYFFKGDGRYLSNVPTCTVCSTLNYITNIGNTTSNTIRFVNNTVSLITESNVGIANEYPVHTLDIGSNIYFTDIEETTIKTSGNIECYYIIADGSQLYNLPSNLENIVNNGNVTTNVATFNHPSLGLSVNSNIKMEGDLIIDANPGSSIFIGSISPSGPLHAIGSSNPNRVSIGNQAGQLNQGSDAVALGLRAGNSNQGRKSVAIGSESGEISQGSRSVAIGDGAGNENQGMHSVALGFRCGLCNQGGYSVCLGSNAASLDQGSNAVAMGDTAGYSGQGRRSIAIGFKSGMTLQGTDSVALGTLSGASSQGANAIAIGFESGFMGQNNQSVAIGFKAGHSIQGSSAIAVGFNAGFSNQGDRSVSIGHYSGNVNQGDSSIAVGYRAGYQDQGSNSITIGYESGMTSQGNRGIAIGFQAGMTSQGSYAYALGHQAALSRQGNHGIAIGFQAGMTSQGNNAYALGYQAALTRQGIRATAIGFQTAMTSQGNNAFAMGYQAGLTRQGNDALAIGYQAGMTSQGDNAFALGFQTGMSSQNDLAFAIGHQAGLCNQGQGAIAIGYQTATQNQGANAIAIGYTAGSTSQASYSIAVGSRTIARGTNSVAIGKDANVSGNNSIVINATGTYFSTNRDNGFFVKPIRQLATQNEFSTILTLTPNNEVITNNALQLTSTGNVEIYGNLNVIGDFTTLTANNVVVDDAIVLYGNNNRFGSLDMGLLLYRGGPSKSNVAFGYREDEKTFIIGYSQSSPVDSDLNPDTNNNFTMNVYGSATFSDLIEVAKNKNQTSVFSYASVGYIPGVADTASFSHVDMNSSTNYALKQSSTGTTILNAATGQRIGLDINNSEQLVVHPSGNVTIGSTTAQNYKLYVNGRTYLNGNPYFNGNAYVNGTSTFNGDVTVNNQVFVGNDTDNASFFGRAAVGYCGHSDWASFAHIDRNTTTDYALLQYTDGRTIMNAASGQYIDFRLNNDSKMRMQPTGNVTLGTTTAQAYKLHVEGDVNVSGSYYDGGVKGYLVPLGAIIMWNSATIPSGWSLCDGSNGTPNLRDRFIVGSGSSYTVGATGGAASVTLTTTEMPSHTHGHNFSGTAATAGAHTHNYSSRALDRGKPGTSGVRVWSEDNGDSSTTTSAGSHSHTITLSGSISNEGLGAAHENRPPYYALAYIMRTGA